MWNQSRNIIEKFIQELNSSLMVLITRAKKRAQIKKQASYYRIQ